ncbi:lytic transglycosylase domain-containing protein [Thiomicrorhabdus sediminis]|uniref:Lytic murein transglycosylase n=1 Tax=Thiomicrorhabdus sediminis TaxID=2580412 RepID=A0A4P9K6A9_9GAMM|nr:lytic transglycosylase domain-containing protein [Thiomicrorhabdus sediminis]QCU90371.1 lytic murein transglycosylase [Thiomicrorhabdus sediminis]
MLSNSAQAQKSAELSAQQKEYLQAYKAIKRNDRQSIVRHKKNLKDYPLKVYLDYHDYRLHMANTSNKQILAFINNNKDNYLGERLYSKWLVHLAKKKHWTTFLKHYTPQKSQDLQCYHIQALANRKQLDKALTLAVEMWPQSSYFSSACRPVDKLVRNKKKLTGSMLWQRIDLAMQKRQTKLAKKLARDLSTKERKMLDYWLKVYKNPALVKEPMPKYIAPQVREKIFIQGTRYLASKDPQSAQKSLKRFGEQYGLNSEEYGELQRKIALRTAYKYSPQANGFLDEVNQSEAKTEDSLRWQAQVALKTSNWPELLETIELMPADMQQDKQWLYWKARALEATQQNKAAKVLYEKLAKQRHYYAFLAADKLDLPYQFNPDPVKVKNTDYLLKKYKQLQRIQELMAVDWPLSAKREWYHLLNNVDNNELQAIAVLAHQWQEHNQAIRSLAKAKKWHDLNLRFPTPYKQPVMQHADKNKIDPAWIYGIMRRESAFSDDIRSHAGAVGLMQIMPATAKYIGRKIGAKQIIYRNLTDAQNNIELGSAYLSYLNEKFNGHKVLATASYNAGPKRVDSWLPENGTLAADQWIDSIPFTETRNYVKAVLEYTTIFKSILNKRYDRLRDLMPAVSKNGVGKTDPKHP